MFRVPRSIDVYTAQHVLMHDSPKMLKIYKILGFDSDSHPGLTSLTISANLEKNITIGYQEHEGEVQTVLVEDEDYEKRLEVLNLLYPAFRLLSVTAYRVEVNAKKPIKLIMEMYSIDEPA